MIIQILLLTMGLDMSRPEFEPITDVSGDYIVGTYDVSSDNFVVEELEDVPIDFTPSVDDSLSTSSVRGEQLSVSGNDDIVSAIQSFQDDNNAFWEQFLADYESNYFKKNVGTFVSPNPFWIGSSGTVSTSHASTYRFAYCEVIKGHTYTIQGALVVDIGNSSSNGYRSGFVLDINNPPSRVISFHHFHSGDPNGYTFTAPITGYYVLCINNSANVRGFDLIETLTYREDISEMRSEFNIKFRVLIFITFIAFAYPIVLSICKNIVGGDK